MDRRRIELQLRVILVTYRVEHRRRDSSTMREFRARARGLLAELEVEVGGDADLLDALFEARREIDRDDPRNQ